LKLILVRHGETYWNKERRVQGGSSDIELNDVGIRQADRLALFLRNEKVSAVASSPLKRATSTGEAIARRHQLPLQVDDGLREIEVGQLEGLDASTLSTTFSNFLMRWWQGGGAERLPGGESLVELQERSWASTQRLLAEHADGTIVVVSHYFVILAIILRALDLPLNNFTKFKVDPASISILEFAEYGTRLVVFNDTFY
jgi:broad specificity phosphatase PhoE